ncbi:MAG TPA: NTP transferase domain-containing protein, partial [Beijerinckia sp.]|nr:NTP transferase domain-containing protein [Beijerinckia sp.]
MGGGDKGLRRIGGRTILERVIETMRPQCAGLVLNANGDAGRLAAFGLPVVPDNVPGFAGPLAGVLAGLDWVAAHHPDIEFAVSVPTDTPFLPADLVS